MQRSSIDLATAIIAVASLLALWRLKAPEPLVIATAGGLGILFYRTVS